MLAPLPGEPSGSTSMPMTPRPTTAMPLASPPPGLIDFERIALVRNPTLQQAFAQFEAARSRSYQAGLYPNPVLGYIQETIGAFSEARPTARGVAAGGTPSPGELVGWFFQQQIVTAGKLRLSRAKFVEEANAAQWQAVAQQLRVLNGVRIAFFEVLAAQRLERINQELDRINQEAVQTTRALVNVGQANEPDLLQAEAESHRVEVTRKNVAKRHTRVWENLITLIGAPELFPTQANLDERPLDAPGTPWDFEAILADLLRCSPEVHAALAEIRRDRIMVRRERAEPIPNILVQGNVGYNYEFARVTPTIQVGAPLPVFNRNQGTVREAMADLSRDQAEYRRVVLSLRQRLADAYNRHEEALESVEDFRDRTLKLAWRAYQVQQANFRQRRAAWPQVLVAQRTYFEMQRDYVESLLELRQAEVLIDGMLLVDGLSPPASPTSQGHIESVPQPR
jgi:cobalt-zinc-cadmium efflux system outer membrane protein